MNRMDFIGFLQGPYDPGMANEGTTPLVFGVPQSGHVLVMAQTTALADPRPGGALVSVQFKLFHSGAEITAEEAFVKGTPPGHGTVCLTYLVASGLPVGGPPAKVTIATGPGTVGGGGIGPEDYYSISVVELEHMPELLEGRH